MKKKQLKLRFLKRTISVFEISTIIGGKQINLNDSVLLSVKAYQTRDGEFHRDSIK